MGIFIALYLPSRAYGGGVLGFQETPFDSKTISKITYLNKCTIINILTSYAQGRSRRSGWSGFGRTTISQGKNKVPFYKKQFK